MPRLSLYRPEKGNDFKFIDKSIWEMFQIGGTDVFVHKYLGPGSSTDASPTTPSYTGNSVSNIQDLLFLENRDRKYDSDIYLLRGIYNIQDTDFNLSQFGLFLQNDTIFVNFHINDTVEKIGRKLIAGDVIELPHLKDQFALNDFKFSLKRFYVIEEVSRAAEGFSATWYPHLYRAKCKPLVDSQEFSEILDGLADDTGTDTSTSLRDILSTYEKEMQITQAVLDQAESDAPQSGYDTTAYYSIQLDQETGRTTLVSVDASAITVDHGVQATDESGFPLVDDNGDPIYVGSTASSETLSPSATGYTGYLLGDGIPPNGAPFTAGTGFPPSATEGQFCLRLDFMPKRLFRFNGIRWVKFENQDRMTMSNLGASDVAESGDMFEGKNIRSTQKASFINNDTTAVINGRNITEKQSLSKALRPKADE